MMLLITQTVWVKTACFGDFKDDIIIVVADNDITGIG